MASRYARERPARQYPGSTRAAKAREKRKGRRANWLPALWIPWSGKRDSNPRPSAWEGVGTPRSDASLRLVHRSGLHSTAQACTDDGPTAPDGPSTDRCHPPHASVDETPGHPPTQRGQVPVRVLD